jgi:uncharacterized protein (DUF1015 family)
LSALLRGDYNNGIIKKHELTRPDKEEDRMILTRYLMRISNRLFFSYKAFPEIDAIVSNIVTSRKADYDFVAEDGFGHHFWVIEDAAVNRDIEKTYSLTKVPATYVADGHHRTAAAARIGLEKKSQNPNHTATKNTISLCRPFPDNHLQIIDYNRVVKDLNVLSEAELVPRLADSFEC